MPSWAFGRKKLRCFNGPTTTTTTTATTTMSTTMTATAVTTAAPTASATTNATTMTMRRQLCSLVCEKRLSKKTWAGVRLKLQGFEARKGEVQILLVLRWCSIDWLSEFVLLLQASSFRRSNRKLVSFVSDEKLCWHSWKHWNEVELFTEKS